MKKIFVSFFVAAILIGLWPGMAKGASEIRTLLPIKARTPGFKVIDLDAVQQKAVVLDAAGKELSLLKHQKIGPWALMAVIEEGNRRIAVFEDIEDRKGSLVYLAGEGIVASLPKSLERTSFPAETLYGGHKPDEIIKNRKDILGEEVLALSGDPTFERVAPLLPPLRVPTFVGTRYSIDKPTFDYGAFSDEIYVDVGKVFPEIAAARKKLEVYEGIVGGWLPVPRFLFPAGEKRAWDVVIFAEENPAKFWTQPLWFRILLIEDGQVKEAHHFYHHLPYPPRGEPQAQDFYRALLKVNTEWQKALDPPMKIEVPEQTINDFCRHALAMEMITRVGNHPKYGYPPLGGINVFGGYGYSNVDTFQDVFNSSVITFSEWGLFNIAKGYIDDYFSESVRDDGSIDTRGPETGQYGLMLAAVAKYYNYAKDDQLILRHLIKIQGIVNMFYALRAESKKVPTDDPSYGIIRGWSEHDSCLKEKPYDLIQPFFSNSADASRGFTDMGRVFVEVGRKSANKALAEEGTTMVREAEEMKKDLYAGIQKTMRTNTVPPFLPGTAGDKTNVFQGRVHAEMMQSGLMTRDMAAAIARFHSEGGRKLVGRGGFLYYGFGYGVLQHDWIKEFILSYYSILAHGYSPGTWMSVESAALDMSRFAPYCTCSELTIPVLTKWMLVFEDPNEPVLWLAKATPQGWLENGRKISVTGAPTRFGTVGYELRSEIAKGKIFGTVTLPAGAIQPIIKVRVRVPENKKIKSVLVNGQPWKDFDSAQDVVVLGSSLKGQVKLEVSLTSPR
jgi:hypothetical protein